MNKTQLRAGKAIFAANEGRPAPSYYNPNFETYCAVAAAVMAKQGVERGIAFDWFTACGGWAEVDKVDRLFYHSDGVQEVLERYNAADIDSLARNNHDATLEAFDALIAEAPEYSSSGDKRDDGCCADWCGLAVTHSGDCARK